MSALVPGQGGGEGKKVCRRELGRSPCRSFPDPSRCEDSSSSREGFLRLSYGSVSVCLLCLLCTTSPPAARVQGPILARFDSFRAKGRVSIGLCSDHADLLATVSLYLKATLGSLPAAPLLLVVVFFPLCGCRFLLIPDGVRFSYLNALFTVWGGGQNSDAESTFRSRFFECFDMSVIGGRGVYTDFETHENQRKTESSVTSRPRRHLMNGRSTYSA